MLNGVGEAAGELIHEYRHLSGHIIQQLEAATIFGAFLTGDALKRLSFQLQRQAPAPGADHFWFGHTPLKRRYDSDNQHYIDTGAVFGGELTLVALQLAG